MSPIIRKSAVVPAIVTAVAHVIASHGAPRRPSPRWFEQRSPALANESAAWPLKKLRKRTLPSQSIVRSGISLVPQSRPYGRSRLRDRELRDVERHRPP